MRENMEELGRLKCTAQPLPRQNVSALDIPEQLKNGRESFPSWLARESRPLQTKTGWAARRQHLVQARRILFNVLEHSAGHSCRYDIFTECMHV